MNGKNVLQCHSSLQYGKYLFICRLNDLVTKEETHVMRFKYFLKNVLV